MRKKKKGCVFIWHGFIWFVQECVSTYTDALIVSPSTIVFFLKNKKS